MSTRNSDGGKAIPRDHAHHANSARAFHHLDPELDPGLYPDCCRNTLSLTSPGPLRLLSRGGSAYWRGSFEYLCTVSCIWNNPSGRNAHFASCLCAFDSAQSLPKRYWTIAHKHNALRVTEESCRQSWGDNLELFRRMWDLRCVGNASYVNSAINANGAGLLGVSRTCPCIASHATGQVAKMEAPVLGTTVKPKA